MPWGANLWLCTWMVACEMERQKYAGAWCDVVPFVGWAQDYLSSRRWLGHSVFDAVRTELQERDREYTELMLTLERMTSFRSEWPQ